MATTMEASMFIMFNMFVCMCVYVSACMYMCAWGLPHTSTPCWDEIVRRKVDIKEHYADVTHSPTRTLGDVKSLKMQ